MRPALEEASIPWGKRCYQEADCKRVLCPCGEVISGAFSLYVEMRKEQKNGGKILGKKNAFRFLICDSMREVPPSSQLLPTEGSHHNVGARGASEQFRICMNPLTSVPGEGLTRSFLRRGPGSPLPGLQVSDLLGVAPCYASLPRGGRGLSRAG